MIASTYKRRSNAYSEISARTAVLATYERLISAVEDEQKDKALEIINGMRCSLDISKMPAFALGMERIYRHCISLIEKGDEKAEVLRILEHLRSVWELALSRKN